MWPGDSKSTDVFPKPHRVTYQCRTCQARYPSWSHLQEPGKCSNCADQDAVEDPARDATAYRLLHDAFDAGEFAGLWTLPLEGFNLPTTVQQNDGYRRNWKGEITQWWNGDEWVSTNVGSDSGHPEYTG